MQDETNMLIHSASFAFVCADILEIISTCTKNKGVLIIKLMKFVLSVGICKMIHFVCIFVNSSYARIFEFHE